MPPTASVVIPTHDRLTHLEGCLASLAIQTAGAGTYEVIVVVDGSTDGTVPFLEGYTAPYPLRWLAQENRGLSAARNAGNALAEGTLVICLDDDMRVAPEFVEEHIRAHADGTPRLVQGGLLLHESVPRTPFIRYEERLREAFARTKSVPGASFDGEDVSGGNISLPRTLLASVGGFNEALHRMRNTDGELAYRLSRRGVGIVYRHAALALMTHTNDLDASLRGSTLYGRSYVFSCGEYPETHWRLSPLVTDRDSLLRNLLRRLYVRPRREWGLGWLDRGVRAAISAAEAMGFTMLAEEGYRLALDLHFWRGAHAEAGDRFADFLPRGIPILCYHDVSDHKRWRFRHYLLPIATFAQQMRWLKAAGYTAISLDALCDYLELGTPLPPRPVVITFDDGYAELKESATPLLAELGMRHTHFLTTNKLAGTTDWVETAPDLPLMSRDDVRAMVAAHGDAVDFQPHGHNHLSMEGIDRDRARREVMDSIAVVEELSGRATRYLAYPYGDYDALTPAVMRELPVRASFTVDRGLARPGQDLHLLSRVEVFSNDFGFDFRLKVKNGWSPLATLRILVGTLLEKVVGRLTALRSTAAADR